MPHCYKQSQSLQIWTLAAPELIFWRHQPLHITRGRPLSWLLTIITTANLQSVLKLTKTLKRQIFMCEMCVLFWTDSDLVCHCVSLYWLSAEGMTEQHVGQLVASQVKDGCNLLLNTQRHTCNWQIKALSVFDGYNALPPAQLCSSHCQLCLDTKLIGDIIWGSSNCQDFHHFKSNYSHDNSSLWQIFWNSSDSILLTFHYLTRSKSSWRLVSPCF